MKNWSSKRKARQSSSSQSNVNVPDPVEYTSSASESNWREDDHRIRPLTTPEPRRETTASPSSWAYRDLTDDPSSPPIPGVDSPSETTSAGVGLLSRNGSRKSYTSSTRKPKPALSKVLGLIASTSTSTTTTATPPNSNSGRGEERSLRRPMSLIGQGPPVRPASSSRPATYGRSTSNPFTQDYSSSSSNKSRPALSNSASFFGLKGLGGSNNNNNHRRNKSFGADSSRTDESTGTGTTREPPSLPPLPSTPRTPRQSSSPATGRRPIVSDKPPVLPALPPIDIELSPPSPPRMFTSASQPVTATTTPPSFMSSMAQHFPGIAAGASPSRSPGATSSLGRANGMALLAGGGTPGSMRRNSLGDLKIPARISRNQVALKSNLTMVREFAAIVEQLKELQNTYSQKVIGIRQMLETGEGVKGSLDRLGNGHGVRPPGAGPPLLYDPALRETTETLRRLDDEYALWWECAELLIELGGGAKEEKESIPEPPEPIPESPPTPPSPPILATMSSVALVEPPQTVRERERAITLGGTESSALAATAAVGKAGGPWRASTGRHGLSQRQLALLKEMLTTPDPSTLSLPLFSTPSADQARQQNPLTFKDAAAASPPSSYQPRQHQPYRSNFPAASAITLPESTTSSSAPSRSHSKLPAASFSPKDGKISPTKAAPKPRRGSRLGLAGIRDMLRSLKKATAAQQAAALPSVQSKANESQSSFDSRNGHGAPPHAPPLRDRKASRTRKGKGSTEANVVATPDANMSPKSNFSPLPEFPPRSYSSQANRKSPRRPSLASLFRIGSGNKGERKKSGRQSNGQDSVTGNASSAADTTTEDDSDWDRIDSASDLDVSVRCASRAETADMELDRNTNQATVRGRRTLPSTISPEGPPPPLPTTYPGMPSASQSSLSLRGSPHHRPTRLPMSITEETGRPPSAQRSTSYTYQRPPSRSSRSRQATNSSLPPTPFNSLLATLATAPNDSLSVEETSSYAAPPPPATPLPQPPLPTPSTPELRLAMTPENIKPLLECSREVSARLNDCMKELERLNLAVNSG
ncbi:hypothetical protein FRB90_006626 [Tulasnella sp. 427]|nr:hypothetical protein FRB90_006626 [Tulasnella sp. 427]